MIDHIRRAGAGCWRGGWGGDMGGQAGRIGWGSTFAAAQDALPGLDLNADGSRGAGDGRIDQAKEVVLSLWGDAGRADMEALAKVRDANGQLILDSNGDGKLTAVDAAGGEFRVCQGAYQDGVTDAGKLKSPGQMGITEIGLTCDDGTSYAQTDDDVIIEGAALHGALTYVLPRWMFTSSIDGVPFREITPFGGISKIEVCSC